MCLRLSFGTLGGPVVAGVRLRLSTLPGQVGSNDFCSVVVSAGVVGAGTFWWCQLAAGPLVWCSRARLPVFTSARLYPPDASINALRAIAAEEKAAVGPDVL